MSADQREEKPARMRATANEAAWREAQDVPTGMRDSTSLISTRELLQIATVLFLCPKHLPQSESRSVVSAPHASRATEFPSETRGFIRPRIEYKKTNQFGRQRTEPHGGRHTDVPTVVRDSTSLISIK